MTGLRQHLAPKLTLRVPPGAPGHGAYFKYGLSIGNWFTIGWVPRWQSEQMMSFLVIWFRSRRWQFPKWRRPLL